MSAYTTTDLIKTVRVRGMFPDASQGTLSPDNILMIASEELRLSIVPMIMSAREKYYETFVDYPMVANQSIYAIPQRAVGSIASVVQFIINQNVTTLNPFDPHAAATTVAGMYPKAFYFENDHIVIYPTPSASSGTIRVRYFQRPSLLEQTINCAQIVSLDQPNGTVTVSTYPSAWASGMKVDFVNNNTPHTPYAIDTEIVQISAGNVISFGTLPLNREGNLAVAKYDWLALAGYTPLPEIMSEFFPLLAQSTVVKLLEALGDPGLDKARSKLAEYGSNALKLITPRDQWGLKKVKSDWRNW